MVFTSPLKATPRLDAYILTPLSAPALRALKAKFELGACSRFRPLLELVIQHPPPHYLGKSHGYIRALETRHGRPGPFVLIDSRAEFDEENGSGSGSAVWYVDNFASRWQVDQGVAESTSVLLEILVRTECLALTYANYAIANTTITEDLGIYGARMPLVNAEGGGRGGGDGGGGGTGQTRAGDCGGLDMRAQVECQDAWVTAEPGEFEESTDPDLRGMFLPRPDRVVRLWEDVAAGCGLVARWSIPSGARPVVLPDGSRREFPEGSVVLQTRYDASFPWPEYRWPAGSL